MVCHDSQSLHIMNGILNHTLGNFQLPPLLLRQRRVPTRPALAVPRPACSHHSRPHNLLSHLLHPQRLPCLPRPRSWRHTVNPSRIPPNLHPPSSHNPQPLASSLGPTNSPPTNRSPHPHHHPCSSWAASNGCRDRTAAPNNPKAAGCNVRRSCNRNPATRNWGPKHPLHRNVLLRKT